MLKYDFENNNEVIDLPSILKITSSQVSITHANGTDTKEIPEEGLTIQIGNLDSFIPDTPDPIVPDEPVNPDPTPSTDPTPNPDVPGDNTTDPTGDDTPTPQPSTTDGSYAENTGGNGIKFVITNNTGIEARLNGKVILNVSRNPNDWENSTQVNANMHAPTSGTSHAYNDIIIPAGETYTSPEITTIDGIYLPSTNFTDGSWYLMNSDNGIYVHSLYIYSRIWQKSKNASTGSNHIYVAAPPQNTKLQRGYTYYLNLYWTNPEATLAPDNTGKYVILEQGKTTL